MKRIILRTLAAAAAATTPSASGFAIIAAAQSDQQPTHAELVQRWAEAALDAQLKGMKTSLRLNADQETLWDPFESAVKDGANARLIALQKEQGDNLSPMDRLNAKADRVAQSGANLKKIVEAAKPLHATLDDAQKHKFITLGRMLVCNAASRATKHATPPCTESEADPDMVRMTGMAFEWIGATTALASVVRESNSLWVPERPHDVNGGRRGILS
jgi:hypothetical protein